MENITYDDWKKCLEKNIKPLPVWWSCEEHRRKRYKKFVYNYRQSQLDWESEDPGEDL